MTTVLERLHAIREKTKLLSSVQPTNRRESEQLSLRVSKIQIEVLELLLGEACDQESRQLAGTLLTQLNKIFDQIVSPQFSNP